MHGCFLKFLLKDTGKKIKLLLTSYLEENYIILKKTAKKWGFKRKAVKGLHDKEEFSKVKDLST
jgi:hypothetical protein